VDYPFIDKDGKKVRQSKIIKAREKGLADAFTVNLRATAPVCSYNDDVTSKDEALYYDAGSDGPEMIQLAKVLEAAGVVDLAHGNGSFTYLPPHLPPSPQSLALQVNEALQPYFASTANPRKRPYPPDVPLSARKLRTQKEYCAAVCLALEEKPSPDAHPFREVMSSYVPKTLIYRTDKHELALLKLTRKLGTPPPPPHVNLPLKINLP
jgi:hypothetical protein